MTRTGVVVTLLVVLAIVGIASMTRITGPGRTLTTQAASNASSPAAASGPIGPLVIPVQGVPVTALHDDWGEARGEGTRVHHAIDIMAPQGTPVLAAADGRIEKLFTSALGGLTLYERSPDGGIVYYYAHLDRYAPTLAEGQMVHAGQTIAQVGATGDADPGAPHLHFEIHRMAPGQPWWQGTEIDPYPILTRRG